MEHPVSRHWLREGGREREGETKKKRKTMDESTHNAREGLKAPCENDTELNVFERMN